MTNLDEIKKTLANISKGEGILDMLLEFERTLDNAELFAYKNWLLGEIVAGPFISRYWFKVTLMFPAKKMPDPDAGLRLVKLGAKVSFRKGSFNKPVKVSGPEDWADPNTKKAKMAHHPVWLVDIELPIKYIDRGMSRIDDIIQRDIEDTNTDLADAYEPATDEDTTDIAPENDSSEPEMPPEEEV